MSKAARRSGNPARRAAAEGGTCRYCGTRTMAPRVQVYAATSYPLTDAPEAPGGARWPHSVKATNPPPLCREAEKGRRATQAVRRPW